MWIFLILEVAKEVPALGGKGSGKERENIFTSLIPAAPGHRLNFIERQRGSAEDA